MQRLKILTWHIHGSYLNTLTRAEHDWFLPIKPGRPEGYVGRGTTFDLPESVYEIPSEDVHTLDLDLIIYQSPQNYLKDQFEILTPQQRSLPRIYLEHNTPRPHPTDTRHLVDDPTILLIHVTHFNQLMWDNGRTPAAVIEHSVAIDSAVRYQGSLSRGLTVVNCMPRRGRIVGLDLFEQARERLPLDLAGMQSEEMGGLGDIPYRSLHRRVAEYRFLFSPLRYTSLPLAVIEAMTIGMPVVALATTELPTVIENGKNGYISCNYKELLTYMQRLLDDPGEARRLGEGARQTALRRFGLERFLADWNTAFLTARSLNGDHRRMSSNGEAPAFISGPEQTPFYSKGGKQS